MTIIIEKQGAVVGANWLAPHEKSTNPPPKRGNVTEFSRKSRRRLFLLMNRLNYKCRVSFITLTFHHPPSVEESNRAFKCFRMWILREYPGTSAVWRRELQPGRGAIHFHLLMFNLPYIPQWHLQWMWQQFTREKMSIVYITLVKNRRHAMAYVSKYVAKVSEQGESTSLENSPYSHTKKPVSLGRAWGVIGKEDLPFAPVEIIAVDDDDLGRYLRWTLRCYAHTDRRNGQDTVFAFTDDADWMLGFCKAHAVHWQQMLDTVGKLVYPGYKVPIGGTLTKR